MRPMLIAASLLALVPATSHAEPSRSIHVHLDRGAETRAFGDDGERSKPNSLLSAGVLREVARGLELGIEGSYRHQPFGPTVTIPELRIVRPGRLQVGAALFAARVTPYEPVPVFLEAGIGPAWIADSGTEFEDMNASGRFTTGSHDERARAEMLGVGVRSAPLLGGIGAEAGYRSLRLRNDSGGRTMNSWRIGATLRSR